MNSEFSQIRNGYKTTTNTHTNIGTNFDYNKLTLKKIFAALFGAHLIIWFIQAGGITWWWKGLPYIVSSVILTWGFCILGRKAWRFDKVQRIMLLGLVAVFLITVSANFLPEGVMLAKVVPEIFVRRSWWNSIDQVLMLILLALFFLTSITITRYIPNGRVWLGFGIVFAIALYGSLRIFSEKYVNQEFWGAGDYVSFSNKNAFGHLLNLGFLFSLVIFVTKSREQLDFKEKIVSAVLCLITGICIFINDSRGGLLSLAVSIGIVVFFMLFKRKKKKKKHTQAIAAIAAIILAFFGAIIAPEFLKRFNTDELSDYRFRYVIWSETISQLGEIALTGTGIQGFKYRYNSSPAALSESIATHAENSFLTIAYEQGLLVAGLLVFFLFIHLVMSIIQKNRSWRAAIIGVGILPLVIIHGMYETLTRFAAINIAVALFLGMLHGQRAWKTGLKNIKSIPLIRPVAAAMLGCVFSWGIFLSTVNAKFWEAYNSILTGINYKTAWSKTKTFLNITWDEFERTSELTYAWSQMAKRTGIFEDSLIQKVADISRQQLTRQPADPLAWMSLGLAQASSITLIDKYDPFANLQTFVERFNALSYSVNEASYFRKLFFNGGIEFIEKPQKLEITTDVIFSNSSILQLASTRGIIIPGQPPPDFISLPFLADDSVKLSALREIYKHRLIKNLVSKSSTLQDNLHESIIDEEIVFLQLWSRNILSTKSNILDQFNIIKSSRSAARSFANANAIYPKLLTFYRDAMGILALHNPNLLGEYYKLLTENQQETFWSSWQRFLVYDPAMRSANLLDWIATSPVNSQIRLQAARMKGDRDPKQLILILKSIITDENSPLQTRLDAVDAMQAISGHEFLDTEIPPDIEKTFEIRARRLIAAYNMGLSKALKYADDLPEPTESTHLKLVIQTAETLEKIGRTHKALEIYRKATENTAIARSARLRSQEVRRRITEASVDPQLYLGRLSVLSRTEDAQPDEILDYLNLSLILDLHLGAREFLESKTPRGLRQEQLDELTYYALKIAILDRQLDKEIQLHKQLLSKQ